MEQRPMLCSSYDEIVESMNLFNKGIGLESRLRYFRAWYYIPEIDAVGPSKFIGYRGMTIPNYLKYPLDGKETESVLGQWFDVLAEGPELTYVSNLVARVLGPKGRPNKLARYCAKKNWRADPLNVTADSAPIPRPIKDSTPTDHIRPIVDVFWRAFLGLYPEDQEILATRIANSRKSR